MATNFCSPLMPAAIRFALHENLLYVLNEGGTPNITGFTVGDDGTLTPLPGSTQPLIGGTAADPAQVSFNPDGTLLVVTEKAGNRLDTYTVDENGLPSAPIDNPSNGMTPFGSAFNNPGFLVVSEAFGGMPNQSAASSYSAGDDGVLSVVSSSVANSQTASCWVVITNNGHTVFVSNTGSGTISSYDLTSNDGTLTLVNPVAGDTGANSAPIDMALNVSSQFLYVLAGGLQSFISYRGHHLCAARARVQETPKHVRERVTMQSTHNPAPQCSRAKQDFCKSIGTELSPNVFTVRVLAGCSVPRCRH